MTTYVLYEVPQAGKNNYDITKGKELTGVQRQVPNRLEVISYHFKVLPSYMFVKLFSVVRLEGSRLIYQERINAGTG